MTDRTFSKALEEWFDQPGPHTLEGLNELAGERASALAIALLMVAPALPLPTGGITHVFEIISVVLCARLIFGRSHIWVPRRWRELDLVGRNRRRVDTLIRVLRFLERLSRPRLQRVVQNRHWIRVTAAMMLALTATAFVAPPFSGLDTLPALGVLLLAMSIVLHDALFALVGSTLGLVGVGLIGALGAGALKLLGL